MVHTFNTNELAFTEEIILSYYQIPERASEQEHTMHQILSVTDAARNFSDVINRVYYQGQNYLLTRSGTIVAQLTVPDKKLTARELLAQWETRPRLDSEDAAIWEQELEQFKTNAAPPENMEWDS